MNPIFPRVFRCAAKSLGDGEEFQRFFRSWMFEARWRFDAFPNAIPAMRDSILLPPQTRRDGFRDLPHWKGGGTCKRPTAGPISTSLTAVANRRMCMFLTPTELSGGWTT
jgi:hypothetical protein